MTKKEKTIINLNKGANELLKDLLVREMLELTESKNGQLKEEYNYNEVIDIIAKSYTLGKLRG